MKKRLPFNLPDIFRYRNGSLIDLTPSQKKRCTSLIRKSCANYNDSTCSLLNNGYAACAQIQSNHLLCRWFQDAVLPLDRNLEIEIAGSRAGELKECVICGKKYRSKSNRSKYCPDCSKKIRREKEQARLKKLYEVTHLGGVKS